MENILEIKELKNAIFFDKFRDKEKYINLTSYATARAVLKKVGNDDKYKATIFVDGFKKKEIEIFTRGIRELRVKTKKIRGVKKDENNAFIRLVDAICGLIRDDEDKNKWAQEVLENFIKKKIIRDLQK